MFLKNMELMLRKPFIIHNVTKKEISFVVCVLVYIDVKIFFLWYNKRDLSVGSNEKIFLLSNKSMSHGLHIFTRDKNEC